MPRVLTLPKATRTLRQGEEGEVRRSPQAVACRKRGVEELGRPQTFLPWKTTVYGLQLLRHGRGNPDTEQCWNLRTAGEHVTGRWRSTVVGHCRYATAIHGHATGSWDSNRKSSGIAQSCF